ncbi:protein timeless homolog isoform X1 [Ricinus communis]|uniref:protein timeless homolog isoform X1 n=1 Tax=Ricinus communis TaxID=3988 RepID=UPI00201A76F2|nr:protein timeless homolog isoform X1 [Ricinus communis]
MQELSLICAGLGDEEEDNGKRIGYSKGENCLENLKDLLRCLRRDDPETREVFKQVCNWKVVSKDLIPIIQYCQVDRSLVLNAGNYSFFFFFFSFLFLLIMVGTSDKFVDFYNISVKVLVFLTMPIEPSSNDILQQTEYLWDLKSAITCSDTVGVIISLLEDPLEHLEREAFTEDDWKLVQLVLTLFRNILAIQDFSLLQKVGGSASHLLSLRDRFLELMFHENVMDLVLIITQHVCSSGYLRQDNLLLLEIFHYIFMGQEPELIAKAQIKDSKRGGETSLDSLKSIMEAEEEKRRKLSRQRNIGRHSQFSGTFTRLTMDGSKAVYKGNPSSASHNVLLKPHKIHRSSTKRIVWDHGRLPSMKDDILVLLHDFLNQFLSGGYNVLMRSISEDIEKEHHAIQNSDIVIFFKVAQFVTSFQYHKFSTFKPPNVEKDDSHSFPDEYVDNTLFKGDVCGPIAASMNESMFLLVISRWRNAFDGLKQTNDYNFLSAAGSLMRIMIRMLDLVLKSLPEGSKESQTARILLYKLFYDQTDQGMTQFLLSLIKSFDTHKQPKSDLADLVEMIHLIVRLMENLQARGALRVSKKSRKVRKKKALGSKRGTENELSGDGTKIQDQTLSSNTEQSIDLSILQKINEENSTSDNQENNNIAVQDNQDNVAVQDSQENINNAIQPDKTEISAQDIGNFGRNLPPMDKRKIDHIDDDLTGSSDDSSSDEDLIETHEVDFKVSSFVSTFANHNIIRNLCWLLRFYKSNSTNTNHYIVCMLQRITDDLDLSPMLYQLSLLTTFYDILDEQKSCPCKEYASIVDFLTTLIRRMLRKMKSQPLLFVEVLFWKSRKECHYINAEYLLHELGHMKKEAKSWGNVLADGELGSSQAKGWVPRSIADALGEDEADVVIAHEPYQKMRESFDGAERDFFLKNNNDKKRDSDYGGNAMEPATEGVSKRRRLVLTDEMEMRIKELHEKYKDDGSCVRLIAESLDPAGHVSPAQVFNKLKQLGLKVSSKKRLRNVDKEFSTFPDQLVENGRSTGEGSSGLQNSIDVEETLKRNTRKKVRAFSKDQEEIIRALFEQFKEHKRCSYMIANALAADNSFTAAQVSRKLKQLGLHIPRQRRSETKLHLRDKELNDFSVGEQVSDDETLLSLRKRERIKHGGRSFDELSNHSIEGEFSGDSDDELLSSFLKYKSKDGDKSFEEQNIAKESSDNEILDSVLNKTRKLHPKAKSKSLKTSDERKTTEENRVTGVSKEIAERDEGGQSIGMDVAEVREDVAVNISQEDASESEATGSMNRNASVLSPHEELDDALIDLEDDAALDTSVKTPALRRKMRMVIDGDDDD